ncbi:hypothetical protein NPIL_409621 [Nephila pilipes]|uniref:Uncharacterized protein n=1 Tax=Nephila pilipes TaxID=299642 RepID=A0A8X6NTN4_NEPPI|nr:hypothetical protein NPIL_409621 [Nephila pilipes]
MKTRAEVRKEKQGKRGRRYYPPSLEKKADSKEKKGSRHKLAFFLEGKSSKAETEGKKSKRSLLVLIGQITDLCVWILIDAELPPAAERGSEQRQRTFNPVLSPPPGRWDNL